MIADDLKCFRAPSSRTTSIISAIVPTRLSWFHHFLRARKTTWTTWMGARSEVCRHSPGCPPHLCWSDTPAGSRWTGPGRCQQETTWCESCRTWTGVKSSILEGWCRWMTKTTALPCPDCSSRRAPWCTGWPGPPSWGRTCAASCG